MENSSRFKFRAWNTAHGIMLPWIDVKGQVMSNFETTHPFIYMQFTGLKDKNGKEIYEGDVLQHVYGIVEPLMDEPGEKYEVIFFYGSYKAIRVRATNNDLPDFMLTDKAMHHAHLRQYEVIGNIWENPALLK